MDNINSVVLIGNLVRDAALKEGENFAVLNFTIATNKTIFKDSQKIEKVAYIDCKYFSKGAAKLAPYLTKGKMVAVSGSLEQESWEKNSQKFSKLTVNVSTLQQLHWDKNNSSSPQNVTADNSHEDFPCF